MKNTKTTLQDVHSAFAEKLRTLIDERQTDSQGNDLGPNIAALNLVRQFLKDNRIEAIAEKKSPLSSLKDAALPFLADEVFNENNKH